MADLCQSACLQHVLEESVERVRYACARKKSRIMSAIEIAQMNDELSCVFWHVPLHTSWPASYAIVGVCGNVFP